MMNVVDFYKKSLQEILSKRIVIFVFIISTLVLCAFFIRLITEIGTSCESQDITEVYQEKRIPSMNDEMMKRYIEWTHTYNRGILMDSYIKDDFHLWCVAVINKTKKEREAYESLKEWEKYGAESSIDDVYVDWLPWVYQNSIDYFFPIELPKIRDYSNPITVVKALFGLVLGILLSVPFFYFTTFFLFVYYKWDIYEPIFPTFEDSPYGKRKKRYYIISNVIIYGSFISIVAFTYYGISTGTYIWWPFIQAICICGIFLGSFIRKGATD